MFYIRDNSEKMSCFKTISLSRLSNNEEIKKKLSRIYCKNESQGVIFRRRY